jgi:hypothetical protein
MDFDAESFFGGKKSKRSNMSNIPDLDTYLGKDYGGFAMFGGQGASFGDDRNSNGFVDTLDFTRPQRRNMDDGIAYGIQHFGKSLKRSESNVGRFNRIMQLKKKKKLQARVELAELNPEKYGSVKSAKDRLDNFKENVLRKKAGIHGTQLTPQSSYKNIKPNIKALKNEIGYNISKIKLAKKIKQLEEMKRKKISVDEIENDNKEESATIVRRNERLQ